MQKIKQRLQERLDILNTPENRIYFSGNLKVALIMLVVAHHAGQPYRGSEGWWYFKTVDSPGLGSFFAVNAAFFMSLFFMISAYFLPATFNKKGASKFLKGRFQRLGHTTSYRLLHHHSSTNVYLLH